MTDLEVRMTIKTLARKGVPNRAIARQLGLNEGTVRYHLKRHMPMQGMPTAQSVWR